MTEITKCLKNEGCWVKGSCRRNTEPTTHQRGRQKWDEYTPTYHSNIFGPKKTHRCDGYLAPGEKEKVKEKYFGEQKK